MEGYSVCSFDSQVVLDGRSHKAFLCGYFLEAHCFVLVGFIPVWAVLSGVKESIECFSRAMESRLLRSSVSISSCFFRAPPSCTFKPLFLLRATSLSLVPVFRIPVRVCAFASYTYHIPRCTSISFKNLFDHRHFKNLSYRLLYHQEPRRSIDYVRIRPHHHIGLLWECARLPLDDSSMYVFPRPEGSFTHPVFCLVVDTLRVRIQTYEGKSMPPLRQLIPKPWTGLYAGLPIALAFK